MTLGWKPTCVAMSAACSEPPPGAPRAISQPPPPSPLRTTATHLPPCAEASKDRSWRVRHVLAQKWKELQAALPSSAARADLVQLLGRLLRDGEAEVRTQATAQVRQQLARGRPCARPASPAVPLRVPTRLARIWPCGCSAAITCRRLLSPDLLPDLPPPVWPSCVLYTPRDVHVPV